MVCLPLEEERAQIVLAEAAQLANELHSDLSVVHVLPEKCFDPERKEYHVALAREFKASSWFLQTDTPVTALLGRARLARVPQLILGPAAWRIWGKDLCRAGDAAGSLTAYRVRPIVGA